MPTAVGIHVFAGGFTRGVLDAGWDVPVQLETHGFGLETTQAMNGVPSINDEDANWPRIEAQVAFGNPRCTAFSTITSGDRYVQGNTHGAWAKQTCDIHQLCEYSAGHYDFVIWESVQQAYKASGRELVDHLVREIFVPRGYRVAHLFINAATFGNCQQRKRYFFVAYRDCYRFNIEPPVICPYYPVLYDAIWNTRDVEGNESKLREGEYDQDSYTNLTPDEWAAVPKMPTGWGLHQMAQFAYNDLPPKFQRVWDERVSDLPFSLHGITRINWLRPLMVRTDLVRPIPVPWGAESIAGWKSPFFKILAMT
jgi:site-specific DNA-cytosine methylase